MDPVGPTLISHNSPVVRSAHSAFHTFIIQPPIFIVLLPIHILHKYDCYPEKEEKENKESSKFNVINSLIINNPLLYEFHLNHGSFHFYYGKLTIRY